MGPCECSDPSCPVHGAVSCGEEAETTVYRVDMDDETGTEMCRGCADDALESGVFREEDGDAEED